MASTEEAAFRQVSEALLLKLQSSDLSSTDALVGGLDAIKAQVNGGHDKVVGEVVLALGKLQAQVDTALTSGVANSVPGCMAPCGAQYTNTVTKRLTVVKDEAVSLSGGCQGLATEVKSLLEELSATLNSAMPAITREVRELVAIPNELAKIADALQGRQGTKLLHAVAQIDLKPMRQCLDISPINAPLDSLLRLKDKLHSPVKKVNASVRNVSAFTKKAPGQVKNAFNVISCLPMSAPLPDSAKRLLEEVEVIKGMNIGELAEMLEKCESLLDQLDVERVRRSAAAFAESAREDTDPLMEMAQTAKDTAEKSEGFVGFIERLF